MSIAVLFSALEFYIQGPTLFLILVLLIKARFKGTKRKILSMLVLLALITFLITRYLSAYWVYMFSCILILSFPSKIRLGIGTQTGHKIFIISSILAYFIHPQTSLACIVFLFTILNWNIFPIRARYIMVLYTVVFAVLCGSRAIALGMLLFLFIKWRVWYKWPIFLTFSALFFAFDKEAFLNEPRFLVWALNFSQFDFKNVLIGTGSLSYFRSGLIFEKRLHTESWYWLHNDLFTLITLGGLVTLIIVYFWLKNLEIVKGLKKEVVLAVIAVSMFDNFLFYPLVLLAIYSHYVFSDSQRFI